MPVTNRFPAGAGSVSGTATSFSFTRSGSVQSTDILLFMAHSRAATGTFSGPAGSTELFRYNNASNAVVVVYAVLAGSATSYSLTSSVAKTVFHWIGAYYDTSGSLPTVWTLTPVAANNNIHDIQGLEGVANGMQVMGLGTQTVHTATWQADTTEMTDATTSGGGSNASATTAQRPLTANGPTGLTRVTLTAFGVAATWALLISPSGGGTPPVTPSFPWKGSGTVRPWLGSGTDAWLGAA